MNGPWGHKIDGAGPILVTGGLGFIGSALTRSLLEAGAQVRVLDDASTGSLDNLGPYCSHPGIQILQGSILDRTLVDSTIRTCSRVFHLASVVGVKRTLDDPERTWAVNGPGAAEIIDQCAERDLPLFVFSSSEVYGSVTEGALSEEGPTTLASKPTHPRWVYAHAKRYAEAHAASRIDEGAPITILRPFNVTGPGQAASSGMVLPRFVSRALRGLPLIVHGDGHQRRTFLHIDDAVACVSRLAGNTKALGRVVNLAGREEWAIGALAQRVRTRLGSSSPIEHVSYREAFGCDFADCVRRVPDLTLLDGLSGWKERRSVDAMIDELAAVLAPAIRTKAAS